MKPNKIFLSLFFLFLISYLENTTEFSGLLV